MDQYTPSVSRSPRMPISGVYCITNTVTGDCYVGSSRDIMRRWNEHRHRLRRETHDNGFLQRAWLKHGPDAFTLTILERCATDVLIATEQRHIDATCPAYNLAPLAGQGPGMTGKKHSAATLAKLSAVVFTEERRANMRASHQGYWTSEMRERHRLSHLGKRPSPEAIAKGSKTRMGHPVSEETRRKLSASNRGKPHGPLPVETVQKMRDAQGARRARERAEGRTPTDAERRHVDEMHAQNRGRQQPSSEIENRRAALKASYRRKRQTLPSALLTTAEAARWLGVAYGTVARWMREGRLPAQKTACGRMVTHADLAGFQHLVRNQAKALTASTAPVLDPDPLVQLCLFPD